jgi:hypothetical protein
MSASDQLSRFIKACPFAVMTRAVISAILDSDELAELFENEAQRQYDHQIPFMAIVWSMAELALGTVDSKNQAYQEYEDQIQASKTAYYNKLNRTEPGVSEALVRYSADKVQSLLDELNFEPWHLVPGYQCFSIDGNHFGQSDRRLKESRTLSAPPLPGSVVAKFDHQTGLFCNAYAMECGHAQENSVMDRVIGDARAGEVYLADRIYCTKAIVFGLMRANAYFVIRQKMTFTGELRGKRRKIGKTETGIVFEQVVKVTQGNDARMIRRVTVELFEPTRDGEMVVHLFTNLPASTNALTIAEAYRSRWEIETGFYHLTMTLCCESKGNCHPRCAIFQFCMAMVAYNARRVLLAAMYDTHQQEAVDNLSEFRISVEVTRYIEGLYIAIDEQEWSQLIGNGSKSLARFLRRVARKIDPKRYKKATRGPKRPPPKKKKMQRNSHLSAQKLLNQRKKETR